MRLPPAGQGLQIAKRLLASGAVVGAIAIAGCDKAPKTGQETHAAAPARPSPPPPPPFTTQETAVALNALERAPDHGIAAERFHIKQIELRLGSAAESDQAEGQRLLRAAVLDYARLQHGLMIPVAALPRAWNQRPSKYDPEPELDPARRAGKLSDWLDDLPPQTPDYRALQTAYVAAKASQSDRRRPTVATAPLDIGEQDERTQALRTRLALDVPGEPSAVDASVPVDEDLIDRVRAYQARHSLEQTGAIDEATAAQLNTQVMSRASRLRVNMERLRWLPRPVPTRRIDVNIASAEMEYFRGDKPTIHMLAVSGKRGDETPILSSMIDSIVLNPPWYVPKDIAEREIIPKGSAYMQSRHFALRGGRLIQQPGPRTALGLVKFDFPNPYAVYLHDTPSKASFGLAQRTASHGCVRIQHAVELAKTVAADEPGLSAERVEAILVSGKTVRLKLVEPVPVRLMYLTTEPNRGSITYVPDVYGWDGELLALLDRYQGSRHRR